jgi:hypothetical protein
MSTTIVALPTCEAEYIVWFQGCIQFNVDQALTEYYSLLKGQFQRKASFRLFGWRVIS